jgi:hypothetical protein
MLKSVKTCMLLGAVRFLLLFDYFTTIYTTCLQEQRAVQFMPLCYRRLFVFIILHYIEEQSRRLPKNGYAGAQLHGAHTELVSLRQMQSSAAAYRPTCAIIFDSAGMAAEGNIEKIRAYLNTHNLI